MKIKFSIIIPFYNAEKFIRRCLNSILAQTYTNYEVILVNDGSTDNTLGVIAEELHSPNIKLISVENQGVSNARNVGVRSAIGEYVTFVDADDLLREDALEKFYLSIENNKDSDVVFSGFNRKRINGEVYGENFIPNNILKDNEPNLLIKELVSSKIFSAVWRHCFKREFLVKHNLLFDLSYEIAEDLLYLYQVYKKVNKFNVVNECLYTAMDNPMSATRGEYKLKHLDRLKVENIIEKDVKNVYPEYLREMGIRLVYSYTRCLINLCKSKDKKLKRAIKPIRKDLRRVLKEYKRYFEKKYWFCGLAYACAPNKMHVFISKIEDKIRKNKS